MTVLLTLFGLIVFAFSCFTVGFKRAFWRLVGFVMTGVILDVIIVLIASCVLYL